MILVVRVFLLDQLLSGFHQIQRRRSAVGLSHDKQKFVRQQNSRLLRIASIVWIRERGYRLELTPRSRS